MTTGVVAIREKLEKIKEETDWEQFNRLGLMEKGIELKCSIINAINKCNKMEQFIMMDTKDTEGRYEGN